MPEWKAHHGNDTLEAAGLSYLDLYAALLVGIALDTH
jgi:hypothetical protein